MLPITNVSSGNDNDSDDFSIILTPSPPQPTTDDHDKMNSKSIPKIKESVEIDDFEHISIANLSNPVIYKNNDKDEQSEYDLIDVPSNGFQEIDESHSDNDSKQNISSTPPQSVQIIENKLNDQISIDHIEHKSEDESHFNPSPTSNASTPNATMEDIITLTEPLNSSRSIIDDEISNQSSLSTMSMDGPIIMSEFNEESKQPLIDKIISTNIGTKSKRKYHKHEYERYITEKSADSNCGCNGYFCCKMQSMQNNVDGTKSFFDNISCIADLFSNYIDKCFGDEHQFNDDPFCPKKPIKKI